jgi:hypothetical protein
MLDAPGNFKGTASLPKGNDMKRHSVTILRLAALLPLTILVLALMVASAAAQSHGGSIGRGSENVRRDNLNGNYNPTYNPNQIAILRWYQANTGPTVFSIPADNRALGTVFDGANIWVASAAPETNSGYLNVFNINGQRLNAVPIKLAGEPYPSGLAYDGSNIWVASFQTLQKVNVVTHTVSTVKVQGLLYPYALAFDGSHIWVTDVANAVFAVSIASPYSAQGFSVGSKPMLIAFDGDCMWITDLGDGAVWSVPDPYGFNCQVNQGKAGPIWTTTNGVSPHGIAYDGTNMWVTLPGSNQVVELDDSVNPGQLLNTITVGNSPNSLAFDGAYIWVANQGGGNVTKLTATNNPNAPPGTVVGTYSVKSGAPHWLTFDGANMWTPLGDTTFAKM